MRVDLHVHHAAAPPDGHVSARLRRSLALRLFLRAQPLGAGVVPGYRGRLLRAAHEMRALDRAVVLALDRPYSEVGLPLPSDLWVPNAAVVALCRAEPRLLLGASVHPYRPDALEVLEAAAADGAVLCKWLPNVQGMDPASPRCRAFYVRLRELGLPLLVHTGHEFTLPARHQVLADIERLAPALELGVTVIAAHGGGGARADVLLEMCERFPRLFFDCSALWTPARFGPTAALLAIPLLRGRFVYGSDFPVPILWPPRAWGGGAGANPLDRRAELALRLGVPEDAFTRAGELCGR